MAELSHETSTASPSIRELWTLGLDLPEQAFSSSMLMMESEPHR